MDKSAGDVDSPSRGPQEEIPMVYTDGFKARQVQRMAGPEGISALALAREIGVAQPTLSRWRRAASNVEGMARDRSKKSAAPRRGRWTPEEKLKILSSASQLGDDKLGAYLRAQGVHEATLRQWSEAATAALAAPSKSRGKKSPEAKRVAELERDLRRKEKALAELAALIVLQKKVQAIWGDEGDNTDTRSAT